MKKAGEGKQMDPSFWSGRSVCGRIYKMERNRESMWEAIFHFHMILRKH